MATQYNFVAKFKIANNAEALNKCTEIAETIFNANMDGGDLEGFARDNSLSIDRLDKDFWDAQADYFGLVVLLLADKCENVTSIFDEVYRSFCDGASISREKDGTLVLRVSYHGGDESDVCGKIVENSSLVTGFRVELDEDHEDEYEEDCEEDYFYDEE